ncbi:hypothetical protein AMQ83_22725, partial [Paenibacillus riograndensis]
MQIKAKREVCSFEFHSVPGDKSISQRAIVLNAIAEGQGTVYNVLRSRDIESCITILRQLGVRIAWNGACRLYRSDAADGGYSWD